MIMEEKIELIIFDMDGLMFDTEKTSYIGWKEAAKKYGYEIQKDLFEKTIGANLARTKEVFFNHFGDDFPFDLIKEARVNISNNIIKTSGVPIKNGLYELISYLNQSNIKKAVATSTSMSRALDLLRLAKIDNFFDYILCGDEIKNSKPSPEIFLTVADKLKCSPNKCIVLEDSEAGIIAAYKANMLPIMIPDMKEPSKEIQKVIFKNMENLLDVKVFIEKYVNKLELNERIDKCARTWEATGAVAVYKEGKCYHKNFYGISDRENKLPITEESNYLLWFNSRFLMGLCIGKLIDDRKLKLGDKLDKYIPEYTHASEITLKELCLKQSGIPDFFNSGIMKEQQENDIYRALSEEKRNLIDRKLFTHPWTFEEAIAYVNGKELTCSPGTEPTDDLDNMTETVFIRQVIQRVSGKTLPDYVRSSIFAPLDIRGEYLKVNTKPYVVLHNTIYMNSEYEEDEKYTFTINYAEAEKLLVAVLEKKLLSQKAWKAITSASTFEQSIAFNSVSGFLSPRDFCYGNLGWSCYIYLDLDAEIGLLHLTNSELIVRSVNGDRQSQFRKEFREVVAEAFVYPKNTKLVPYGKTNLWEAMELTIEDKQLEYMSNAKRAICIAYAYKQKLFVLMEGARSVGLVAFKVDKRNKKYYIESVLIDRKYQSRGFGKIMMVKGIEYLKSQGCDYITIGVNRFNLGAQQLYKSVGFKEKTVYEDFIEMEAHL